MRLRKNLDGFCNIYFDLSFSPSFFPFPFYFISFCYPTFRLGFYGKISHFPQVNPLVPGLKLLEEDEKAKFLTKTEQKNCKNT